MRGASIEEPEYAEQKLLEESREPTNSTQTWRRDSNRTQATLVEGERSQHCSRIKLFCTLQFHRTHCNSHENRPEKAGPKRSQFSPTLLLVMTIDPITPSAAFTLPQNIGGPQKAGVPYSRSEIQCIVLNKTKCLQYISKRRLNDKKVFKLQF